MHRMISNKINLNNEIHKIIANFWKRIKEFTEGDYVMVRPERFPPGILKNLHAPGAETFRVIKKVGPNAYVLELPPKLGISSNFNLSEIVEYGEPAMIPSEYFEPDPIFESESIPECPQII